LATAFTGTRFVAATASARRVFWADLPERLALDLALHGLTAEQTLPLADFCLKLPDPASSTKPGFRKVCGWQ